MNEITDDSNVFVIATSAFLIAGAGLTLIGAMGLLRLRTFYERAHAPTLGTTLGTTFIGLASIIHFSATGGRVALHELLIIVFVTATTPVSLLVLVGAARFRSNPEDAPSRDNRAR